MLGYTAEEFDSLTFLDLTHENYRAHVFAEQPLQGAWSCAAFTVAHVGWWGWGHLLIAGFGGAALTALYLWRRNLGVNILAHAVVDGAAFLSG
jgi:hypothetical protein